MGNVTKSQQNNITSPNGNSLAVFVDGATGVMKVKDVMGNIQPLSDFLGCRSPFMYDTNNTGIKPVLGNNESLGQYSTIGGGHSNASIGCYNVIGGGNANVSNGYFETIGGGYTNTTNGGCSTIGGGIYNNAVGQQSTVSGGRYNIASGNGTFIGGGRCNIATQTYGTVSGGYFNCACSCYSTIGGGYCNVLTGAFSSVLGGKYNEDKGCCNAHLIGSNLCATQNDTTFMNCVSAQNLTVGRFVCVGANKVLQNAPTSVNFGLFAQTSNSTPVADTTVEGTLIDGGVGSLSVPSNGFTAGDSFLANLSGIMSAKNATELRIRVKSGSVVLADSGNLTMPSIANQVWSLSLYFTIRSIGGVGVASIVTQGEMLVLKASSGNQEGFGFNTLNNTTFDTTISNTLNITVQWATKDVQNSIYSNIFVLSKTF